MYRHFLTQRVKQMSSGVFTDIDIARPQIQDFSYAPSEIDQSIRDMALLYSTVRAQ